MVDVVTTETFNDLIAAWDVYKAAIDARLATLEAAATPMPQDVKDKLIAVLEWLKVNV
jgi:hypothetical protein